jgi:hypothetical protein
MIIRISRAALREGETMEHRGSELPTVESIAKYVNKNAGAVKRAGAGMTMHMGRDSGMESVRKDEYHGHSIVVRTSYRIEVDGKEIMAHLALTNDGQVQYHGLPNYSFDSAVDLVKKMIDVYPDDFAADAKTSRKAQARRGAGAHTPEMKMAADAVPAKKARQGKRSAKRAARSKTGRKKR